MKKRAVLLVFKPEVGEGEIRRMCFEIRKSLDPDYHGDQSNRGNCPQVHSFDPEHGSPVFYVP